MYKHLNRIMEFRVSLPARKILVILTVSIFSLSGCKNINKEALIEDIRSYEAYISGVHANPYRLITKNEFDDQVDELINEILKIDQETISRLDCYFYLQKLAASIQDGHTRIYPPSMVFSGKDNVFPLKLRRIDGEVYVIDSHNSAIVPKYSSILEINQIPIDTLFKECSQLFSTSMEHAKWYYFEEYFDILLTKYFKFKPPWKIKYKIGSKAIFTDLNAVNLREFNKAINHHDTKYSKYSIRIQDEEIPVLLLPNFSYGRAESYQHFIDSFFSKYAESQYLIVDIRENRGGSGYWGIYLLDNFASSDYQVANSFVFKVSETMRKSIYARKAGNNLSDAKNGEYIEAVNHRMRVPHKTPKKFNGKVFLLISEKTYSAGVVFAALFKANDFGIIVGRETAGREKFCSDPVTVKFSNSKLKGSIPVAVYTLPGENPNRGVIPDIVVAPTIDDYRLGKDVDMEKVKSLIQKDMIGRSISD